MLFLHLEQVVQELLTAGIACEVWIDGSFLTEKDEPNDLDVTIILDADVPDILNEIQLGLIQTLQEGQFSERVDSFVFVKKLRDDPDFGDELADPAYSWGEQYGLECGEAWLKGFAVLRLRETNVGLRLCS